MIIVSLSDIHGNLKKIDKMSQDLTHADLVLITGDLTNFGGKDIASRVLNSVRFYNKNVLAVSGNCDYSDVDLYLDKEGINIHGKNKVFNGYNIIGIGGSLYCPVRTPNVFTEDDFKDLLDRALKTINPDLPIILVSHQPPFNTLCDLAHFKRHVGSKAVRDFISENQPKICFTGHIHEAKGIDSIGGTKVVNPGPASGGSYAYVEIGSEVDVLEIRNV